MRVISQSPYPADGRVFWGGVAIGNRWAKQRTWQSIEDATEDDIDTIAGRRLGSVSRSIDRNPNPVV